MRKYYDRYETSKSRQRDKRFSKKLQLINKTERLEFIYEKYLKEKSKDKKYAWKMAWFRDIGKEVKNV